jgi:hypothetical protein
MSAQMQRFQLDTKKALSEQLLAGRFSQLGIASLCLPLSEWGNYN